MIEIVLSFHQRRLEGRAPQAGDTDQEISSTQSREAGRMGIARRFNGGKTVQERQKSPFRGTTEIKNE